MKRSLAVCAFACLGGLVLGIGVASGQGTDFTAGWGSYAVAEPAALEDLVAIAGGSDHSLGLKSGGTVVGWGDNRHGECVAPAPNADFVAVAGGQYHSLAIGSPATTPVERDCLLRDARAWGWRCGPQMVAPGLLRSCRSHDLPGALCGRSLQLHHAGAAA
jgi:hypothetical protein